jgi:hypothetical protein
MKYLYLLVRHMFPRKHWHLKFQVDVTDEEGRKLYSKFILQDQFGNLKVVKTK